MPFIILSVCLGIITIYLAIKLNKKQDYDKSKLEKYQKHLQDCQNLANEAQDKYNTLIHKYEEEESKIDKNLVAYQEKRTKELEALYSQKQDNLKLKLQNYEAETQKSLDDIQKNYQEVVLTLEQQSTALENEVTFARERYEGLLTPLKQYELDKQQRLYYTIQIPEEYQPDIDFLLNTVSQKVRHPDIINKLVWSEYVKPYIDETFKRAGIESKSGIYKITNIDSGKAYIGKSTDIKKRLTDHFKSAVGITSIADQAVHHAILKEGLWNWTIESIIYCDKDKLSELEKYYIDFFHTNTFGYNKTGGGEG